MKMTSSCLSSCFDSILANFFTMLLNALFFVLFMLLWKCMWKSGLSKIKKYGDWLQWFFYNSYEQTWWTWQDHAWYTLISWMIWNLNAGIYLYIISCQVNRHKVFCHNFTEFCTSYTFALGDLNSQLPII